MIVGRTMKQCCKKLGLDMGRQVSALLRIRSARDRDVETNRGNRLRSQPAGRNRWPAPATPVVKDAQRAGDRTLDDCGSRHGKSPRQTGGRPKAGSHARYRDHQHRLRSDLDIGSLCEIGHQGPLSRDAHLRLLAERCGWRWPRFRRRPESSLRAWRPSRRCLGDRTCCHPYHPSGAQKSR